MKRVVLALALIVAACSPAQAPEAEEEAPAASAPGPEDAPPATHAAIDETGNRLEALTQRGEQFCTESGDWCIDATGLITSSTPERIERAITTHTRDSEELGVWPWLVRGQMAEGGREVVLLGQTYRNSDMYSGGSAGMTWLTLYAVSNTDAEVTPALSVLLEGSAMIRACFDEDDMRERFEACHDEYALDGSINLATYTQNGAPILIYESRASTYPGVRSRTTDVTETPLRSAADVVWVRDETCSIQRTFERSPQSASEAYTPDQPLPECSDYQTQ